MENTSVPLHIIKVGQRSVVSRAMARSPLKLLTPRNRGHAAWVYTSTYGGGYVDGDVIALEVDVGRDAAAMLSTQASTKVYRTPTRGARAVLTARVAPNGLLVVIPDPIVCFAGATYEQHQSFELDHDASLVFVDWLVAGRRARGERWAFDEYHSRLSIRCEGRLLVHDAMRLSQLDGDLPERLGRFDVLAVVALVGPLVASHATTRVAESLRSPIDQRPDSLIVASPLGEQGCLIRLAGTSTEEIQRSLKQCLSFVPDLLGDDPWARKW